MKKTLTAVGFAWLLAAMLPSVASAQPVDVQYASGGAIVPGTATWDAGYYGYVNGEARKRFYVGMLNLERRQAGTRGPWQALPTYCIQPDQYLALPATYRVESLADVVASPDAIGLLWAAKYQDTVPTDDEADTSMKAAAFQTMVWEFTKDGSFDLSSGDFALDLSHGHTSAIAALATSWFAQMSRWTETASLAALTSDVSQNQLAVLPAPGSSTLGLAGLFTGMGVTFSRRRRV
ncbi:MAG: thioester domain-containing protein [Phycisphaerales bacterium]|nr:thioester domain-containing protein [Phycisphaerales bacterium]